MAAVVGDGWGWAFECGALVDQERESDRGKEGMARVRGTDGECGTLLLSF